MIKNEYLELYNQIPNNLMNKFSYREDYVLNYAWGIPNEKALQLIKKYNSIIEMGAGTGYWAYLLSKMNVDIITFDKYPPLKHSLNKYHNKKQWYDVQVGSYEMLKKYPNRTLFLCWAPYAESFAFDYLNNYEGKYFICIGESIGGCTGNDDFFDLLKKEFIEIEHEFIPQWYGLHDYLKIYERIDSR